MKHGLPKRPLPLYCRIDFSLSYMMVMGLAADATNIVSRPTQHGASQLQLPILVIISINNT
jgi:hypothetical protein